METIKQTPRVTTDDVVAQLEQGITNLTSSEAWAEHLRVQARFHNYSFGNALLIHRQCEHATRVAGFHSWKALGRSVRKGEKAIRILAPITVRNRDENNTTDEPDGTRFLVGFKAAAVFDISQTDGKDLPEAPCSPLTGDTDEAIWSALVALASEGGFEVKTVGENALGKANGDCSGLLKRIRVRDDLSGAQRVKTLAHEIAHSKLHVSMGTPSIEREVAELEAESVAFVVCAALGIDSSSYSFGYVAGWSGGGDEAVSRIRACGSRIQQTAKAILDGLNTVRVEVAA